MNRLDDEGLELLKKCWLMLDILAQESGRAQEWTILTELATYFHGREVLPVGGSDAQR